MKIALLGDGKTGSKVAEILNLNQESIFNLQNPPDLTKLKAHDIIISFLPGDAFLHLIPMLVKSKLPVVTGSTGFEWPEHLDATLKNEQTAWIYASNFSLGMNLIKGMIDIIKKASLLYSDVDFKIHEIHHTKKLDAPSGTALSWQKWLDQPASISSERIGDVVGVHTLSMNSPTEKITLEHQALDRKIFAEGAIWTANKLYKDQKALGFGLHSFMDIVKSQLHY
ncbi:MAG: hypothetical protein ISR65_12530 [Bacteriovoracaceae bacterium]|nr:hypothetical protein [Bacteriovoracaceae bacterium]